MLRRLPCGASVLVVDDDDGLRQYIGELLQEAGYAVSAAATGHEALVLAGEQPPDAVVLDVCLPGLSGYEVCRVLKSERHDLPVLFISGTRIEALDRVAGLLIGGDDYLVKPFAEDELLARLRTLIARRTQPPPESFHNLTRRELEVLSHLADGLGQGAIAERLLISPRTVGTHVEHIFQKLGVRSRAAAVAAAYKERLVDSARV